MVEHVSAGRTQVDGERSEPCVRLVFFSVGNCYKHRPLPDSMDGTIIEPNKMNDCPQCGVSWNGWLYLDEWIVCSDCDIIIRWVNNETVC